MYTYIMHVYVEAVVWSHIWDVNKRLVPLNMLKKEEDALGSSISSQKRNRTMVKFSTSQSMALMNFK